MRLMTQRAGLFFTTVDAAMTFGFGMFSAGVFMFKPVMAFALGGASFALALLPALAVIFWTKYRLRMFPIVLALIAAVGFWFNLVSNTGFTAALFQTEIITAANENQVAQISRDRLKRLQNREKELTKTINFWPTNELGPLKPPSAYKEEIDTQQRAVDLEASRGGCKDKCIAKRRELARLIQARDMSADRQKLIAERAQIKKELGLAEKDATENQTAVSAAASQSEFVARFMTLNLKPGQTVQSWTIMGTALAISFFISLLGWTFNAAAQLLPKEIEPAANEEWAAERELRAIPAPAYSQPGTYHETINITTEGAVPPSVDRLMELARQYQAKRGAA